MLVIKRIKNRRIIISIALLTFLSIAVKGQSSIQQVVDETWKEKALFALADKYMTYRKSYKLSARNSYSYDFYWKFYDLNRFPFGTGLHKLKEELKANKIVFDSIICEIEQNVSHSNFELLLPAAYYIFEDGKIVKLLLFDADALSFSEANWEYEVKEEMYRKSITKTDNVFYSLLIFTKIYPDWRFEISKITINSHY